MMWGGEMLGGALELNVGEKIMKNDKIMTKSTDFCMKFVKNRPENAISNPDTDLIIIYFCCLVPTRGISTVICGVDLFFDFVAQNGVSGHEIERSTGSHILFAEDFCPHAKWHLDA